MQQTRPGHLSLQRSQFLGLALRSSFLSSNSLHEIFWPSHLGQVGQLGSCSLNPQRQGLDPHTASGAEPTAPAANLVLSL